MRNTEELELIMEANFDDVWYTASQKFFVSGKRNERLRQAHREAVMPFEEKVPGFCRRLYYIPHCKVLEAFETNRPLGEKLGLNTRENCWFYEKWQGRGPDRVFIRAWTKGHQQWGDITTALPQGHRVSYWKEDSHYRCFGEYEKTSATELTKKVECRLKAAGERHFYCETITKTPDGETGEKLKIVPGQSEHTKWEITKHSPEDKIELDFTDLREIEGEIRRKIDAKSPQKQPILEKIQTLEAESMRTCAQILQEKGYQWAGLHNFEENISEIAAAADADSFVGLLGQVNEAKLGLIAELVGKVMALRTEITVLREVERRGKEIHAPRLNMELISSFSPAEMPFQSIFEISDASDSNPFKEEPHSFKDNTPFSPGKHSFSPIPSPASASTSLSIGGIKVIPRQKVRSSLANLHKVRSNKERRHLRETLIAWKERSDELNSSMRLRDSISEIAATPRSSIWSNDASSAFEQSFEVVISKAAQVRLAEQTSEFEELITQEMSYLLERCHLKHSFKFKGERFLMSLGDAVFPIFEDLMDKKYAEIGASAKGSKPVKSLSQFFSEEMLPGRTFTREQLKVFGRFMVTVMRMNHDGHPYGQFVCRLLRIDHPRPIFDNAGKIITQLRYEALQSNSERDEGLQFYEQISTRNAFIIARKLFQYDEACVAKWLSSLKFEGLNEVQTTAYWISLILSLDDSPTAFADLFPVSPAPLDQFLALPLHNALSDNSLSAAFHFYSESDFGLTSEAWERLITDGDFLLLANSSLPLCQLLEAVVEAFHDLQLRIAASVKEQFHGREAVQIFSLSEVLRAVFPGLKPTAVNDVFRTANEVMGGDGDSVTAYAVIQAIFRLKLEVR